jgi:hypothetical protein
VNDQKIVAVAALTGALVGGLLGYLYLTAGGRRVRDQIEPRLDDALTEIGRLRQTIGKAQAVAAEGWRSLGQLAGSGRRTGWDSLRQSPPH